MSHGLEFAREQLDAWHLRFAKSPPPLTPPSNVVDRKPNQPLLRDVIAWFDQAGFQFGKNARVQRNRRPGYVLRVTPTHVVVAPLTTSAGDACLLLPLPMKSDGGMFWMREGKHPSYIYKQPEKVGIEYYAGTLLGKAHPPISETVRAFLRNIDRPSRLEGLPE